MMFDGTATFTLLTATFILYLPTMASLLERMNLPTNSLPGPGPIRSSSKSQSNRGTAAPYVRALFSHPQWPWYQR